MRYVNLPVLAVLLLATICSAATPKAALGATKQCAPDMCNPATNPYNLACLVSPQLADPICVCRPDAYWDEKHRTCLKLPNGAARNGWQTWSDEHLPITVGWLFFSAQHTWAYAADRCTMLDGALASIKDAGQNTYLLNFLKQNTASPVHIGLSTNEAKPVSSSDPNEWFWYSQLWPARRWPYENWQTKDGKRVMPDANLGNCGWMLHSGEWANGACDETLPFVCELPL